MISPFVWVDIIRFQHSLFAFGFRLFRLFVFFVVSLFALFSRLFSRFSCFFVFFVIPLPLLTGGESGVSLRLGRVAVVLFAQCSQLGGRLTGMEML